MVPVQKVLGIDAPGQKVFKLLPDTKVGHSSQEVPRMRVTQLGSLASCVLIALLVSSLVLLLGPGSRASAMANNGVAGHVYVLNNDLSGSNSITVFNRQEDGSLKLLGTTSIGGLGSVAVFADGTQGSLILARDERTRLFAVDAGSDQISVVNVHGEHLSLAGVFASGGAGPVSLSYQDGLLYVLNAANGRTEAANVAGFHVDNQGRLHPIAGATQPLSAAHPNAAQVQIDPSGQVLLVTEKGTNLIDVYHIHQDGSLSGPTTFSSVGAVPFGMAFNPASPREFIVTDAAGGPNKTGAATAYHLANGSIQLITGPVFDHQIAPCWLVITQDGHFAYTSNADSHAISGYRIHTNGKISLLNANGVTALTPSDTFPLEEALSRNRFFLYVLDSRLLLPKPGPATLSGFLIHQDGSLTTVVAPDKFTLPVSAIGLAAE